MVCDPPFSCFYFTPHSTPNSSHPNCPFHSLFTAACRTTFTNTSFQHPITNTSSISSTSHHQHIFPHTIHPSDYPNDDDRLVERLDSVLPAPPLEDSEQQSKADPNANPGPAIIVRPSGIGEALYQTPNTPLSLLRNSISARDYWLRRRLTHGRRAPGQIGPGIAVISFGESRDTIWARLSGAKLTTYVGSSVLGIPLHKSTTCSML